MLSIDSVQKLHFKKAITEVTRSVLLFFFKKSTDLLVSGLVWNLKHMDKITFNNYTI